MLKQRPFLVEALTAVGLIAAPFVLPHLGFAPTTINRILIWGLFGLGFDILFGYHRAAVVRPVRVLRHRRHGRRLSADGGGLPPCHDRGRSSARSRRGVVGYLVGLIALRRTGIYFAMITVAIAEVFFFVEFNPLSDYTGGENGLPGVPTPSFNLGFTTLRFNTDWSIYVFLAFWYFVGLVIALRIVRSPVGAILSAIRDNPLRAAAVGHNIHGYKLTAFVVAAAYAGFAGGLLGMMQGFMPPDAFTFDTSGQLVMQTAIGGAGTLFGPLVGAAVWLYLSDFFQTRCISARPGSWCSASCSCCWSASCAAASSAASHDLYGSVAAQDSRAARARAAPRWPRARSRSGRGGAAPVVAFTRAAPARPIAAAADPGGAAA